MSTKRTLEPSEQAVFWRQLASLLRSGLTLPDALTAIGRDAADHRVRQVCDALRAAVEQGEAFSDALATRGPDFDPTSVACARAGEKAGDLPAAADVLASHGQQSELMRLRGRMVLTYPLLLLGVAMLTGWILSALALGKAHELFSGLGGRLPLPTRLAMVVMPILTILIPVLLVLILATAAAYRMPGRFPGLRRRLDGWLLRIPLWNRYYRALVLSRLTRTLSLLLGAGVPLHDALALAGWASGNAVVREQTEAAARRVADGSGLAEALAPCTALSDAVIWAIRVGERRGDMEEILPGLSDYLDETAGIAGSTFLTTIEPLAVLVVGLVGGFLILAWAMPVFQLPALIPY